MPLMTREMVRLFARGRRLNVPQPLVVAYREELLRLGMMTQASDPDLGSSSRATGGESESQTIEHFVHRFGTSAARLVRVGISRRGQPAVVTDDLLLALSDGDVAILDIPSGCGAASLALVSWIAVMREKGSLPKYPLRVHLFGSDISQTAGDISQRLALRLAPALHRVAMHVEFAFIPCDLTNGDTISVVMDNFLAPKVSERIVALADFSGATKGRSDAFREAIQHIRARTNKGPATTFLLVEPNSNDGKRHSGWLGKVIETPGLRLRARSAFPRYYWYHPFQKRSIRGSAIVQGYKREVS
jgi:hypothetical protein